MSPHPGYPAVLELGPVVLRPPRRRDATAWSASRRRNAEWLIPWEPSSPLSWNDRSTPAIWRRVAASLRASGRAGSGLPFVVEYGGRLVGQMNVSNIVHGALRNANVGYWIDAEVAGRGIAPAALALVVDHCFAQVGLHRIEVDIRPENGPSLRVVEKLGFRREGFYERFLDINGGWRDHVAFALTREDLAGTTLVSRLGSVPRPPG
ncbi:MAG: rimJ [Pseudonocardiales bacterium]|nr:rimJ [Pseudonocardiales bacterium]